MFLKVTKAAGKPICVILYAVSAFLAAKKTKLPLILLACTHFAEYLVIGYKVAKEANIGIAEGFLNCLAFGFTWWLPIKKEK